MSDLLFCPIRQNWVASLPEEKVRQSLIREMIDNLGYPQNSIAIEKSLDQLPHLLSKSSLPKRRADLIVFAKDLHAKHPFYPLLLVECKAVPITDRTLRQIAGYNHFVGAHFIAIVNQTHTYLGYDDPKSQEYKFFSKLMPFNELLQSILSCKLKI